MDVVENPDDKQEDSRGEGAGKDDHLLCNRRGSSRASISISSSEEGKNAVILKHNIDAPFISHLEHEE